MQTLPPKNSKHSRGGQLMLFIIVGFLFVISGIVVYYVLSGS